MAPSPAISNIYTLTFNCGRLPISPTSLSPHFFSSLASSSHPPPDLITISLQEIAPIAYSFLGSSWLSYYFDRLDDTLHLASSVRFGGEVSWTRIVVENIGMTALVVYIKEELIDKVTTIQKAGTGFGLWDMGNKSAVGARIFLEDGQEITFIAVHLAPHEKNCAARNDDFKSIVRNTVFGNGKNGIYDTTGSVFIFGDLNYRTSDTKPALEDLRVYPLSVTDSQQFLERDQLNRERKAGRTLHFFEEVDISFPPTYKYNHAVKTEGTVKDEDTWNWAPHRFPSWTDRILYLPTGRVAVGRYKALPIQITSDHRPVALSMELLPPYSAEAREAPYPINLNYASERAAARRKEVVVGILAYLSLTREGNTILVGLAAGGVAGWYLIFFIIGFLEMI